MGQYYVPTLVTEEGKMETFLAHEYDNGLKLMEHSWIGNNFVAAVLSSIEEPKRVWWLGDYATDDDFKNNGEKHMLDNEEREQAWSDKYDIHPADVDDEWLYDGAYLINIDKKCYVKLEDFSEDEWKVCPLPLLTAVGNGKGGGDYWKNNINYNLVGIWAGDMIIIKNEIPEEYRDFEDKTDELFFAEDI